MLKRVLVLLIEQSDSLDVRIERLDREIAHWGRRLDRRKIWQALMAGSKED
jgi:hypothetical protein